MDNTLWTGCKAGKTIIPTYQYVKQISLCYSAVIF